ncbi:hypothetical protein Ccrd_004116 [Cynara cardunculus var. scolymus]|uniref:Uncharacterized protein n=1 Tax=Cynara cardunculus var. scolymus TaxID=59895 RepID=A0A103XN56_CYNCS|nr:hypothetical protein Ccrd_004116 [Cynara cardunculus var. scolymus]
MANCISFFHTQIKTTALSFTAPHKEFKMSYAAKTIRRRSFRNHAEGYSHGTNGYYYPPSAKLQGDGDDNDTYYDYAPAASEGDGDDDDADYDYAPAASDGDGHDDDDRDYDYAPAA